MSRRCKAGSTTTRGTCGKSGLFLNNRHYDPSTGVFVSVDPLVTTTGEPYIYGSANPVTFSDPSGLCSVSKSFCSANDAEYIPGGGSKTKAPPFTPASSATSAINNQAGWSYDSGSLGKDPSRGVLRLNAFIPREKECIPSCGIFGWGSRGRYNYDGDDRGFIPNSTAFGSRVALELNFETGRWQAFANYTCNSGGSCGDAYPIAVSMRNLGPGDLGLTVNSNRPGDVNIFDLTLDSRYDSLSIHYEINNPIQPFGVDITAEGTARMRFSSSGLVDPASVGCACDGFPSIEIYQFNGSSTTVLFQQTAGIALIDLPG